MYLDTLSQCNEERRCYFEDWKFSKELDKKIKCCRCLDWKSLKDQYENGKCAFFKANRNSYSGSYDDEMYSEAMLEKIKANEQMYKVTHGIIGKRR